MLCSIGLVVGFWFCFNLLCGLVSFFVIGFYMVCGDIRSLGGFRVLLLGLLVCWFMRLGWVLCFNGFSRFWCGLL